MPTKIFVNLPVRNLEKSIAFYEALGFARNPQFTDETAACIVISDAIYAMLLTHAKFREFTNRQIADARKTTEVLTCLSVDSRGEVDRLSDAALQAGGTETREPLDYGFMFNRSFDDPDGHIWEVVWMDEAAMQKQMAQAG